jgi:hypothetical protein
VSKPRKRRPPATPHAPPARMRRPTPLDRALAAAIEQGPEDSCARWLRGLLGGQQVSFTVEPPAGSAAERGPDPAR